MGSSVWGNETSTSCLYGKAQSAVRPVQWQHMSSVQNYSWSRQGCLLSRTLFNIVLESSMCEALVDHEGCVSIGGKLIINFRFGDYGVVNVEEEEETDVLVDHLDGTRWRSVLTRPKPNSFWREVKIKVRGLKRWWTSNTWEYSSLMKNPNWRIQTWDSFQDCPETTAALSRPKIVWRDKKILLASKVKLMRTHILSCFLYARESWTLTPVLEIKIRDPHPPPPFFFYKKKIWRMRRLAAWSRIRLTSYNGEETQMLCKDPLAWRRQFCRGQ